MDTRPLTPTQTRFCPNCHHPLAPKAVFCGHCGQKYTDGKVTVKKLFRDFLDSFFNLDARVLRTLRDLLVPGKLTQEYFHGRQRRYTNPVRLFFVLAAVYFAVLGFLGFQQLEQQAKQGTELMRKWAYWADMRDSLDKARLQVEADFPEQAGLSIALDSLERLLPKNSRKDSMSLGIMDIYIDGSTESRPMDITYQRLIEAPIEEIVEDSGAETFIGQLLMRQMVRSFRDTGGFIRSLLSKLIWMVLLMMPALALFLKLLYWRSKRYYVEHLVFSFHYHAFGFLLLAMATLLSPGDFESETAENNNLQSLAILAIAVYLYLALKRYYGQGYLKTLFKWVIINIAYLLLLGIAIFLTFAVGAILF